MAAFPSVINLGDLTPTTGFQVTGAMPQDQLGTEVASAGDVNGDGLGDFIVNTTGTSTVEGGATYVIFGVQGGYPDFWLGTNEGVTGDKPDGLPEGLGFRIYAGRSLALSGYDVVAGDVNGDGFSDLMLSAPRWSAFDYDGAAFVVFGKATGHQDVNLSTMPLTTGFRMDGDRPHDSVGWPETLAMADLNGDGLDEMIVSGYNASPEGRSYAGSAWVVWGKAGGVGNLDFAQLAPADGFRIDGANAYDYLGQVGRVRR
jgi:hypothetical protein